MRRQILVLTAVLLVAASSSTVSAGVADGLAQPYLHIQLALANDSMDGVTEAAHVIVTESDAIGEVAVSIGTAARAVAGAMDISTARAAFGPLSDALIAYGEEVGFGELRVAYCPMARKSWVQQTGAILNPFYGSMMLNSVQCGDVSVVQSDRRLAFLIYDRWGNRDGGRVSGTS